MKALVCYNPKSGKQKLNKNLDYVKNELKKKYDEVDFYATTGQKSIIDYLIANAKNYDLVVVSGGDGTLNETVTGLIKSNSSPKLAYIPGGTCNDVGSMLHLPKNIKKACKMILNDVCSEMDICKANDSYFVYVLGAGKFINISYETPHKLKKRLGKVAYLLYGIKDFIKNKKMHVKFEFDGKVVEGDYYVFLGLNSNHVAGLHIFRDKMINLNDGLFDLTLVEKKGIASWPRLLRFMLFGDKALIKYGVNTYHISDVKITSDEEISYNVDGEFAFSSKECEVHIIRKAIRIILPLKSKNKYF